MFIFEGQNINPNSGPIVANNAEEYTLQFNDDDGSFGVDDQDDTVTIINVTDPNNPVETYTDVSFVYIGAGVFPANATPAALVGREVVVIDIVDGGGNVIDSFFLFTDDGPNTLIANGNARLNRNSLNDDPNPICLVEGAMVTTPIGSTPVQSLKTGDMVSTSEGPQEVIYVSSAEVSSLTQILSPHTRQVVIAAGAFGDGAPAAELRLSQQHRIKFSGLVAETMFGANIVFAPARAFVGMKGVSIAAPGAPFSYHHVAVAAHTAIHAEGLEVETLFVGDVVEGVMSGADLKEVKGALAKAGGDARPAAGGMLLTMAEGRVLSEHLSIAAAAEVVL